MVSKEIRFNMVSFRQYPDDISHRFICVQTHTPTRACQIKSLHLGRIHSRHSALELTFNMMMDEYEFGSQSCTQSKQLACKKSPC